MAMGLVNVGFDTKSFRDRYKLFQSRCKTFHVLGLKNKEHARNVFRVHSKVRYVLRRGDFVGGEVTGQIPEELGESAKREGERVKRLWNTIVIKQEPIKWSLHLPYKPLDSLRSRRFQSSYCAKVR